MNKNILIWYWIFTKRLFRRYSFILILCLIPVLIPIANFAMKQESGVVNIALCSEDKCDISEKIINDLLNGKSVLKYKVYKTREEAVAAVNKNDADTAWIFNENFENNLKAYAADESAKPFVTIIVRENTIPLQLVREKLFSAMYPYISYEMYLDFMNNSILNDRNISQKINDEYNDISISGNLIEFKKIASGEKAETDNYLVAPLRGLLAMVIMLCGLASAMYYLKDRSEGKYDWLSHKKRIIPAFGSCLAGIALSAAAVFWALLFADISVKIWQEICAMILYIASATGFCMVLCGIYHSDIKLGASIPFFMIIILVFCPIFFRVKFLPFVKYLIPTYYYLNAVYSVKYLLYMVIYCIASYALAYILCFNAKNKCF